MPPKATAGVVSWLLLFWTGLVAARGDEGCPSKSVFMNDVTRILNNLPKVPCSDGTGSVSWDEYCSSVIGAVEKCPHPVTETMDFFSSHCILSFIYHRMGAWHDDMFGDARSAEWIRTALGDIYTGLPPERCGRSGAQYCARDADVCSRDADPEGHCLSLEAACNGSYPALCVTARQPYALKQEVQLLLEQSGPRCSPTTPPAGTQSEGALDVSTAAVAAADTDDPQQPTPPAHDPTMNIVLAVIFSVIFIAILLAIFLRKCRNRRSRA